MIAFASTLFAALAALSTLSVARPIADSTVQLVPRTQSLTKRTLGVGSLEPTRDYLLQLDKAVWTAKAAKAGTSVPAVFAGVFHQACINVANNHDEHHVMDVAQDQPGTDKLQLFAFCGGKTKKVPGGGVNENGVGPIHDNTLEVTSTQANLIEATVLEKPMSLAQCEKFKKANPSFPVVCA